MKPPRTHFFIALIFCAGCLGGYWYWFNLVEMRSLAAAEIEEQVSTKNENANKVTSARAILSNLNENETLVQDYFVHESDVVTFIDGLEALGRAQKTVVAVSSVSTSGSGTHKTLNLSLTIVGSFDAVLRTSGAIEYSPYALSVVSIAVTQSGKNEWHADLKLMVGSTSSVASSTISK